MIVTLVIDEPEGNCKDITISLKYSAFTEVFSDKGSSTLAPINDHIHTIDLEGDTILLYSPIYPLTEPELQVL